MVRWWFIYLSFHLREMYFIHYLRVVYEMLWGDVCIATVIILFLLILVALFLKALPCYILDWPWTICLNQHKPYHHLPKLAILFYHLIGVDLSTAKTKQMKADRISNSVFTVWGSVLTLYICHMDVDVKEDIRACTCCWGKLNLGNEAFLNIPIVLYLLYKLPNLFTYFTFWEFPYLI